MTYEEFDEAVALAAEQLPDELFDGLTGGVITVPTAKLHEMSLPESPLYVAGQYTRNALGKQVVLYFGSFEKLYGRFGDDALKSHIREVLLHELKHHWEFRAGERTLVDEDDAGIEAYLLAHSHAGQREER